MTGRGRPGPGVALLLAFALLGSGGGLGLSGNAAAAGDAPRTAGIPADRFDRVVELFNHGVSLMERYQPAEAAEVFREVVTLAPHWTTGRLNLGIALLNCQDTERNAQAESELRRVMAEDPVDPHAYYALAILLRHQGRDSEAIPLLRRVLEIDPEDADAHYQMGVLLAETDPAAARRHLEKTLEVAPNYESAVYRLQTLLRQAGETERATKLLERFQALKAANVGRTFGMKYGEMGRYASIIRAFDDDRPGEEAPAAPSLKDEAAEAGLSAAAPGKPGWPGDLAADDAQSLGPGTAVADVDGDGDLDVFIPGLGDAEHGGLYLNDGQGRFTPSADSRIDSRRAVGAYFGDYDKDGDPDLYLTCAGPNRLYANGGDGRFSDVTAESGTAGGNVVSAGASWADADHDGDLDLYVANAAAAASGRGAPNAFWRNNGNGTFTDVAAEAGVDGGDAATMSALFFDVDGDLDLDLYLVNDGAPNRLFLNQRVGAYTEATSRFPLLADAGRGLGAVLGDVDHNGLVDVLLIRGSDPPRLFLQTTRAAFVEDQAFAAAVGAWGAAGGLIGDLDLDADLDLVLLDAGTGKLGHRIFVNDGTGRFAPPVPFGGEQAAPAARGAVAADLSGNGRLELLVARSGGSPELWTVSAPGPGHWLEVLPSLAAGKNMTGWSSPDAVGLTVEVKTGTRLQVADVVSSSGYLGSPPPRAHFGLGSRAKADYVRLSWPDAVLQSEMEIAGDRVWPVIKVERKPSSCPLLFCWDGERFAFVTDFLGVGGMGFFIAPGEYGPPDPTEDVRIPPEAIASRDGRYLLRVAEPLEEVSYVDELHLLAYDHPADWDLYPDERFTGSSPFPTGKPFAVSDRIFPEAARDTGGRDVLDRILEADRRYAEPPTDPRFVGYADDHWIELDFGDRLAALDPGRPLVLCLYGWVEYTYSHVNYAAYQAGLRMRSPWIEVPGPDGGWVSVLDEAGFPAGLPRMMTLDVSSLPIRSGRFRIRTNMEVFWDQIFLAQDARPRETGAGGTDLQVHVLRPAAADLRFLGYPREYSPDGADPTLYDYQRIDQGVPFKNLTGTYTRYGDVRPLLDSVDDAFVVMGRGEEIALEFDAGDLPPLAPGMARTFVLHVDGYCKDMDLYTAFPFTVDPMPYHAMENYPPPPAPGDGNDRAREWNTRRITGQ